MNSIRNRDTRAALFDGIEEGGIRASSSYSHEIDEQENDRAIDGLQDRVAILKRVTHDEFNILILISWVAWLIIEFSTLAYFRGFKENSCQGNDMDASRVVLSGTMDKFKMEFETKSSRSMFTLVVSFVVILLIIYYFTR